MNIWLQLLVILGLVIVATGISTLIRMYVLTKYKVKKLYILITTIVLFVAYILLTPVYVNYPVLQYAMLTIVSIAIMTYFELARMDREEKNKPVVGRPKAKQNRANKEAK